MATNICTTCGAIKLRCDLQRGSVQELFEIQEESISGLSAFLESALNYQDPAKRIRFTWRGRLYDLDRTCAVAFFLGVEAAHDALDQEIEEAAMQLKASQI
jgi:hypothetical protein